MRGKPTDFKTLQTDHWIDASVGERLAVLQRLEVQMAAEQGRPVRTVTPIPMKSDGHCGYYDSGQPGRIFINQDHLSDRLAFAGYNYDAADTVIHEGRHAYQDDAINGVVNHDPAETELWEKNFSRGVYNNPATGTGGYRFQPIEADANDYSQSQMEDLHHLLGEDQGYDDYLYNRNAYDEMAQREAEEKYGLDYEEKLSDDVETKYDNLYGKGSEEKEPEENVETEGMEAEGTGPNRGPPEEDQELQEAADILENGEFTLESIMNKESDSERSMADLTTGQQALDETNGGLTGEPEEASNAQEASAPENGPGEETREADMLQEAASESAEASNAQEATAPENGPGEETQEGASESAEASNNLREADPKSLGSEEPQEEEAHQSALDSTGNDSASQDAAASDGASESQDTGESNDSGYDYYSGYGY